MKKKKYVNPEFTMLKTFGDVLAISNETPFNIDDFWGDDINGGGIGSW